MIPVAVDSLSSSLHVAAADFRSSFKMHAGGASRCWLLRQINKLTLLMEEEDGLSIVPASFAGGQVTGG